MMIRYTFAAIMTLLVYQSCVIAAPPLSPELTPPKPQTTDKVTADNKVTVDDITPQTRQLLDRLEAQGSKLKSYQAKVILKKTQGLLGDEITRVGIVAFIKKPHSHFTIRFENIVVNQSLRSQKKYYTFDSTWLTEQDFGSKVFIKRQIVPPGQTFDPLQIGQGPFPLPLGQKTSEIIKLFKVEQIKLTEDELKNKTLKKTFHLKLIPRIDPKTKKTTVDFDQVDIWYDNQTLLPIQIQTFAPGGNETLVKLKKPMIDQIDDAAAKKWFNTTTPKPGSGWRVEIKPWRDATPALLEKPEKLEKSLKEKRSDPVNTSR